MHDHVRDGAFPNLDQQLYKKLRAGVVPLSIRITLHSLQIAVTQVRHVDA